MRDGQVKLINASRGARRPAAALARRRAGSSGDQERLDQTDSGEVIDTITVKR